MSEAKFELGKDLLAELRFHATRSSGPGGQNVNKVNSKIELRWSLAGTSALSFPARERFRLLYSSRLTKEDELIITSGRFREQQRNKEECISRFAEMVQAALRPPKKRRKTKVPRSVKQHRMEQKARTGRRKSDRRKPAADF